MMVTFLSYEIKAEYIGTRHEEIVVDVSSFLNSLFASGFSSGNFVEPLLGSWY